MDKMFDPLNTNETKTIKPWERHLKDGDAIAPIPDNVELIIPSHKMGKPIKTWEYRDADGLLLMCVFRFIDANGNKQDRPLTVMVYQSAILKANLRNPKEP